MSYDEHLRVRLSLENGSDTETYVSVAPLSVEKPLSQALAEAIRAVSVGLLDSLSSDLLCHKYQLLYPRDRSGS